MAKPEEENTAAKPEAKKDGAKSGNDSMKIIIINLVSTMLVCVLFLSVSYVLQSSLLDSKMANISAPADENSGDEEVSGEGDEVKRGFILDLGDFVLNLSDVGARKYLKVNVALEVSNKESDAAAEPAGGGGHGHGESAPATNPIETEMAQFKPSIRDAVITNLSSKTSTELSTVAGKELAKEQIAEAVNGIFAGEREVIRVSFGQFIIQ